MPAPFTTETAAFLADFGQDFTRVGGGAFRAILDQPDDIVGAGAVSGVSRQYQITYATSAISLARGEVVSTGGVQFKLREAPTQIDDGAFTQVTLSKQ